MYSVSVMGKYVHREMYGVNTKGLLSSLYVLLGSTLSKDLSLI